MPKIAITNLNATHCDLKIAVQGQTTDDDARWLLDVTVLLLILPPA
jgi:hypothetical protein